jgi:DNA modification methylase
MDTADKQSTLKSDSRVSAGRQPAMAGGAILGSSEENIGATDHAVTSETRSRRLEYVAIDQIKPNPHYARKPNRAQRRKLKASYRRFGENAPVLVDKNLVVLAGTQRLVALKDLGYTHVWVLVLDHLSDTEARAYAIADNKIAEYNDWDDLKLAVQLKELSVPELEFDLEATGFEAPEIDFRIQSLEENVGDSEDDFEVSPGPAVSELGDLWILGDNKIYCGDSLSSASYVALMAGERASAVFSDPPYNVPIDGHVGGKGKVRPREFPMAAGEMSVSEFTAFLTAVVTNVCHHMVRGALLYLCMDWRHLTEMMAAATSAGLDLLNLCVWVKPNGGMGSLYRSRHELVFVFRNGSEPHQNNVQLGKFGRNRTNVWNYAGANSFARRGTKRGTELHPTAKPVLMVSDAILDCTQRNDIVLDPFLGGGSTLLAAERTGRRCCGVELDPLYVDVAIERWQKMTRRKALNAFGETFEFVKAKRRAGS